MARHWHYLSKINVVLGIGFTIIYLSKFIAALVLFSLLIATKMEMGQRKMNDGEG